MARPEVVFLVLFWIVYQGSGCTSNKKVMNCGKNKFKCMSGECISASQICDGLNDCKDESDENNERCGSVIRNIQSDAPGGCSLPEQPPNGSYKFVACSSADCEPVPDLLVKKGTVLSYKCQPPFQLLGPGYILCADGWSPPPPSCGKGKLSLTERLSTVCPPLNDPSRTSECELKNIKVACNETAQPGTKAIIKCKDMYETIHGPTSFTAVCKRTGDWSYEILSCKPVCGVVNMKAIPLKENGTASELGSLPWHASVYRYFPSASLHYMCGGTIVSTRMIVTSAVCLWDPDREAARNLSEIRVTVGKLHHKWDKRTKYFEEVNIDKIALHPKFKAKEHFYQYDIALIILKKEITINEAVRPVCIDYSNKYLSYFAPGMSGLVTGRETEETNQQSEEIQTTMFPFVPFERCESEVPESFIPFLTSDKFCVGHFSGTKICSGYGGSGYATQFRDGRWYLMGIVSVGPATCSYSALTRVPDYYEFLMSNNPENEESILTAPPHSIGCRSDQIQCKSGGCLELLFLCDGRKDCEDGSDETKEVCYGKSCKHEFFRCKYGACIQRNLICDGKEDCVDGSDEYIHLCIFRRPSATASTSLSCVIPVSVCKLPEPPKNGQYKIQGCAEPHYTSAPGNKVSAGAFLNFTCNPGYVLVGFPLLVCSRGWSSLPPICKQVLCPPLVSPSRDITCVYKGDDVDCDNPVQPGTRASVRCKGNYETVPGLVAYDVLCNSSGLWSRELQSCVPKCGQPNPKAVTYVSFGTVANAAEFPWHVGFYKPENNGSYTLFCGGSIVSLRVVVTAAHCFWNFSANKKVNTFGYRAVAGKFYRNWNISNQNVQHLEILEVILHKYFRGTTNNYISDIAVVILKRNIIITAAIRPICVDYDKNFFNYFVPYRTVGKVVGWGITENMTYSDVLKTAALPYIYVAECEEKTPIGFHPFILRDDNFCAGYENGTSVCPGDSGGAYAVQFKDKRWYLVGIISLGVAPDINEECNLYNYAGFTKVFNYVDFIREYVYKYV